MAITLSGRENAKDPAVRNGRVPEIRRRRQAAELAPLELEEELEEALEEDEPEEDELGEDEDVDEAEDVEAAGFDSADFPLSLPLPLPLADVVLAVAGALLDDVLRLSFR
jgi:hypothetical protein